MRYGLPYWFSSALASLVVVAAAASDEPEPLLTLDGNAHENLGRVVANIGDINGDGDTDLAVGAPNYGHFAVGRVYVYFGGLPLDETPDMVLTGEETDDKFGHALALAGDFNGDGSPDLIVGAYRAGSSGEGEAYVYCGGAGFDDVPDYSLVGEAPGDIFGSSVAGVQDVNADGFDDVLVGADYNQAAGQWAGRAYVYFGGPDADESPDLILTAEGPHNQFGFAVSSAADLNADSYFDFAVGAFYNDAAGNNAGRVYVYYGGPALDALADLILDGEAPGDHFGMAVASAGDVDGDLYDDLIVGAPRNDAGNTDAGRAYVFFGGPTVDSDPDLVLTSTRYEEWFGYAVGAVPESFCSGQTDVVIGNYDGFGTGRGLCHVYFGGPDVDEIEDLTLSGEADGDLFGNSVASAGDVDGDGFAELFVGAPFSEAAGEAAGRAYVYGNPRPDLAAVGLICEQHGQLTDSVAVKGIFANVGNTFIDPFDTRIEVTGCIGLWADTQSFGPLLPGEADTIVAGPFPRDPGACDAMLLVDYNDDVQEWDEDNNILIDGDVCAPISVPGLVAQDGPAISLQAVPNPSTGTIRLSYRIPGFGPGTARIFDSAGRLVWSAPITEPSGTLSWDGATISGRPVAPGVYFILVQTPDHLIRTRVVVARQQ